VKPQGEEFGPLRVVQPFPPGFLPGDPPSDREAAVNDRGPDVVEPDPAPGLGVRGEQLPRAGEVTLPIRRPAGRVPLLALDERVQGDGTLARESAGLALRSPLLQPSPDRVPLDDGVLRRREGAVFGDVPPRHREPVLPRAVVDGPHHPQLFEFLDLFRGQASRGVLTPLFRDPLPEWELDAVVVDVDVVDLHPQVGVGAFVALRGGQAAQPVPGLGVDDPQFDEPRDLDRVAQGGEPQDRPPLRPLLAVLARLLVRAVDVVVRRVRPRRQLRIPVHLRHGEDVADVRVVRPQSFHPEVGCRCGVFGVGFIGTLRGIRSGRCPLFSMSAP